MIHLGDITKIKGAEIPIVDAVTGGSPCQDLSVAGKRAGLEGERSGLFMEQIRVIKEMRENDRKSGRPDRLVRPRFMVWENVPGTFSSNKGEDFRAVLEETIRIVEPSANVPGPPRGGGTSQEPSWEMDGASLGEYTMPSFGVFHKEENGFVYLRTSMENQHQEYYLILNCGERPRIPNPTKLSQIIEENPNPKYNLSAKACQGILNRAAKRGKTLPNELEEALINQSHME